MGYVSGYRMHNSVCVMSRQLMRLSQFTSPGLPSGLAVGVGVGDSVGDTVGVGDAVGFTVSVGDTVGVGDGVCVGHSRVAP